MFTRPFGDVFNLPTMSEEVQTGGIYWGLPLVTGPHVCLPKALLQTGTRWHIAVETQNSLH